MASEKERELYKLLWGEQEEGGREEWCGEGLA